MNVCKEIVESGRTATKDSGWYCVYGVNTKKVFVIPVTFRKLNCHEILISKYQTQSPAVALRFLLPSKYIIHQFLKIITKSNIKCKTMCECLSSGE